VTVRQDSVDAQHCYLAETSYWLDARSSDRYRAINDDLFAGSVIDGLLYVSAVC